jgi:hypothetical protein
MEELKENIPAEQLQGVNQTSSTSARNVYM